MRIYLPSTVSGLQAAAAAGQAPVRSGVAFAVTDALRREYPGWTEEELEYLAMLDASRASLRLLAASPADEPALRVVLAADVDEVRAAAAVIDAADLGDDDAEFALGSAEDFDLAWYAPGEIRYLLEELTVQHARPQE
jgi:predicted aminopeptidase